MPFFGFPEGVYDMSQLPFIDVAFQIGMPTINATWDFTAADFDGDLEQEIFFVRQSDLQEVEQLNDQKIEANLFGISGNEIGMWFASDGQINIELGPDFQVLLGWIKIGSTGYSPSSLTFTLDATDPLVWGTPLHNPAVNGVFIYFDTTENLWKIEVTNTVRPYVIVESTSAITNLQTVGFTSSDGARTPQLLKQTSSGYTNIAVASGVNINFPCSSVASADFDNDMDVDIYMACKGGVSNPNNVLLENDGTGVFHHC